jgi:3-hydroxyisobutyrate dehydrogenase-like beta-hydroxyacid dehydrogenase
MTVGFLGLGVTGRLVAGLAEAFHFAGQPGLDPALLRDVLDTPMASFVSRGDTPR